ncbi:MAG: SIS domain-containing protein, partial [Rudaea sp.]
AGMADHVILLGAGEEKSIAATKTYTASLASLALLAVEWCGADEHHAEMSAVPGKVAAVLRSDAQAEAVARTLIYLDDCAVIGRGLNYATAFETALKLKELAYVRAEPYSSADFMHGPIAIVQPNYCVIEIAPGGAAFQNMLEFAARVKASGGRLIAISDRPELLEMAASRLELPDEVPEWLSPLVAIVPGQLLALHLTLAKGYEADHPRGLTKVTRTL